MGRKNIAMRIFFSLPASCGTEYSEKLGIAHDDLQGYLLSVASLRINTNMTAILEASGQRGIMQILKLLNGFTSQSSKWV